jgi:quinolinate synthase
MLYGLQQAAPETRFIPANPEAVCPFMRMITLPKLRNSLRHERFEVKVPADIARAAGRSSGWSRSPEGQQPGPSGL